ncbi:craniofacial development protein 1 [Cynoglossus semilaevis]|uniref:Craniofacial development protein 1 n=1 Tax=Cynoglossus semilaevis TaxID=244447 RepID=A0A3P8UP14_CYNSE|nr:craniofacial development protein 1 [Cynoglossus semilaevis]
MMNYSDYDSDGYESNDDADYVPSDDNLSEDDINECVKEDPLNDDGDEPRPDDVRTKKNKKKDISVRKRKKGVLKLQKEEEKDVGGSEQIEEPQEDLTKATGTGEKETKAKKKADDLWASFLSDVGSRPKESTPASPSSSAQKEDTNVITAVTKTSEPAKVTITKVFDFAGEEIRVQQEVSADSKEAKTFFKSQNKDEQEKDDEVETSSTSQTPCPGPSAKRPAGMSNLLGRIGGKKQKMSTLEKSKMDWDAFKSEEGITEELAIHNRGREGYVERKNFLDRVDHRQFELEKAVRLSNMKP